MWKRAIPFLALAACVSAEPNNAVQNANIITTTAVQGTASWLNVPYTSPGGSFTNDEVLVFNSSIITSGQAAHATAVGTAALPSSTTSSCPMSGCNFALGFTFTGSTPFGLLTSVMNVANTVSPVYTASITNNAIQAAVAGKHGIMGAVAFALPIPAIQTIAVALGRPSNQWSTLVQDGLLIGIVVGSPSRNTIGTNGLPPFVQGASVTLANNTTSVELAFPDNNVTTYTPSTGVTNTSGLFFATLANVGTLSPQQVELAITASGGNTWATQTTGIAPGAVVIGVFYAN